MRSMIPLDGTSLARDPVWAFDAGRDGYENAGWAGRVGEALARVDGLVLSSRRGRNLAP